MDILGHVAYGATLCSRAGLAGGRGGSSAGSVWRDWTVWAAAGFALFPDVFSIGLAFAQMAMRGESVSFHGLPSFVFTLYRLTHSLIIAGFGALLLRRAARPVALPALAWPVHILMDSVLHDDGRWQTPMLFPFSEWHFPGINWWQHPKVVLLYWGILPLAWIALHLWRRKAVEPNPPKTPPSKPAAAA